MRGAAAMGPSPAGAHSPVSPDRPWDRCAFAGLFRQRHTGLASKICPPICCLQTGFCFYHHQEVGGRSTAGPAGAPRGLRGRGVAAVDLADPSSTAPSARPELTASQYLPGVQYMATRTLVLGFFLCSTRKDAALCSEF